MSSIQECDTVTEYLERIKSQFYGSSKTYTTQLIKQLMTEKYSEDDNGTGIREHISKMNHLNNKLKINGFGSQERVPCPCGFCFFTKRV
jgi:hypothetical protein